MFADIDKGPIEKRFIYIVDFFKVQRLHRSQNWKAAVFGAMLIKWYKKRQMVIHLEKFNVSCMWFKTKG
jgi:hypothetical protein